MRCPDSQTAVSESVKIEMDVSKIEPTVGTEIERMGAELLFFLQISEVTAFASEFFHMDQSFPTINILMDVYLKCYLSNA